MRQVRIEPIAIVSRPKGIATAAMLIVCPSCASRYELDAAKLGPAGRKVRCATCKTQWHVEQPPDFPPVPDEDETRALLEEEIARAAVLGDQGPDLPPDPQTAEATVQTQEPPAAPPRKRAGKTARGRPATIRRAARKIALPLSMALGGIAIMGLLLWQREAAVRAAPQLAGVFAALGMPVNIRGLSLSAIESGVVDDGTGRFLVVEGDITNITRHDKPVPPIEVAVRDAGGQTLYTWATTAPKPSLEPSELIRFRARLATPPEAGRSVQVRFATDKTPSGH